jgi:2-hydroxychromene-2-carboxylate isomerase
MNPITVDYCFASISPWAYLGHARLTRLLRETGAAVRVRPIDLGAIFPVSGGLPLGKRAPQRQAYRLVELQRFSAHLGVPLIPQPAHFPTAGDPSARLIVAVDVAHGSAAALDLAGRVGAATWAEQRDIADPAVLRALLAEAGLDAALLDHAASPEVDAAYRAHTQWALDAGVFGSPTYVIDGEIYWGQDRLDFVERRLRG